MSRENTFRAKFRRLSNGCTCWQKMSVSKGFVGPTSIAGWVQITEWDQYTGLKDKNGVEIYEGDIVDDGDDQDDSHRTGVHQVKFEGGAFSPFAVPGWECVMHHSDCEVIGNIHESPELIGG